MKRALWKYRNIEILHVDKQPESCVISIIYSTFVYDKTKVF